MHGTGGRKLWIGLAICHETVIPWCVSQPTQEECGDNQDHMRSASRISYQAHRVPSCNVATHKVSAIAICAEVVSKPQHGVVTQTATSHTSTHICDSQARTRGTTPSTGAAFLFLAKECALTVRGHLHDHLRSSGQRDAASQKFGKDTLGFKTATQHVRTRAQ